MVQAEGCVSITDTWFTVYARSGLLEIPNTILEVEVGSFGSSPPFAALLSRPFAEHHPFTSQRPPLFPGPTLRFAAKTG